MVEDKLRDGMLVRHKVEGYEGYVEGITRIKALFTEGGQPLDDPKSKQIFQYRIVSEGESVRRITPVADIEILEGTVGVARRKPVVKGLLHGKRRCPESQRHHYREVKYLNRRAGILFKADFTFNMQN